MTSVEWSDYVCFSQAWQICINNFTLYNFQIVNDFIAASAVKNYNSAAAEPFLNGSSSAYVEEMYNSWLRDPATVHAVILNKLLV